MGRLFWFVQRSFPLAGVKELDLWENCCQNRLISLFSIIFTKSDISLFGCAVQGGREAIVRMLWKRSMSETPFEAGSRVRKINNPTVVGTVLNAPQKVIANKIKQRILFDDGNEAYVSIHLLEPDTLASSEGRLQAGDFGTPDDLIDCLLDKRLGESLEDMIYSLNLTNTEFKPYQFKPLLTFFSSYANSLLIADEVGLGKTIEAGLIWTELTMREHAQRLLVICPAQLCAKWQQELLKRFDVSAEIVTAEELGMVIDQIYRGERRRGAYIISLSRVRHFVGEDSPISQLPAGEVVRDDIFQLLILDEAHRIRNDQTLQNKGVAALRMLAKYTLFLSATPIQTGNDNLFTLLHLLDRNTYRDQYQLDSMIRINKPLVELEQMVSTREVAYDEFKEKLDDIRSRRSWMGLDNREIDRIAEEIASDADLKHPVRRLSIVRALNGLNPISRIMTRSLKRNVEPTRAQRNVATCQVEMTEAERAYYEAVTEAVISYGQRHSSIPGFVKVNSQQMMSSSMAGSLVYWRSITGACDTADGEEDGMELREDPNPLLSCLHRVAANFPRSAELLNRDSKFEALMNVIRHQHATNDERRMIVFSFFRKTLLLLEERLSKNGFRCRRIDGTMGVAERNAVLQDFEDGRFDILLSSEVASEGVDLEFANCLVNYDLPWNPAKIEQRIGRIDRIGQKSPTITIVNLVYKDTVEERIYSRLLGRLNVFQSALGMAEEVLGKTLRTLTDSLFSRELTPEQQEAEIDRAVMVLANLKRMQEEAEGASVVYDWLSQQAQTAREQERCIVEEDLVRYVENFCRYEDSQLVECPDAKGYYKLKLSASARALLCNFLQKYRMDMDPTDIVANPELKLKFQAKAQRRGLGVERVTANHPLIRFISNWRRESKVKPCRLSSVRISLDSSDAAELQAVKPGYYAYSTELWKLKTQGMLKTSARLAFAVHDLQNGTRLPDAAAELLINKAARFGKPNRGLPQSRLDAIDEGIELCNDAFEDEYADYRTNFLLKAEEGSKIRIRILEERREAQMKDWSEKLRELESPAHDQEQGIQGRRASMRSRIEKGMAELDTQIKEAEYGAREVENHQVRVSSGVIFVEG